MTVLQTVFSQRMHIVFLPRSLAVDAIAAIAVAADAEI
jgi:hypothetical protein